MKLTQEITLDIFKAPLFEYINAKQEDNVSRVLVATITANGETLKPDHTRAQAVFRATKPDKTGVMDPATIGEDGKITFALTDQVLAVPGDVEAEIAIVEGDQVLTTATFYIQVERRHGGNNVTSENEFLVLVEAAKKATDAATAADTARQAADEAEKKRAAAETQRAASEQARADAETSRRTQEDARNTAETARAAAEKKREQDVNTAVRAASTAAGSANKAAAKIDGLTVSAKDLPYGSEPTATKTEAEDGHISVEFGIPEGKPGKTGPEGPPGPVRSVNGMTGDVIIGAQHSYRVIWDQVHATMTRGGDSANITTDTKNFGHFGSVNPDYDNPFDNIYPWSGRRLCNIDIETYMALKAGDSLRDCVVAWEGDPDFSYEHQYGVWVYTPECWGRDYIEGDNRVFEVSDMDMPGLIHYPEDIGGRWHGVRVNLTVGGEEKDILLPLANQPFAAEYPISTMHAQAKAYGATLESIYSLDKDVLLYVVEYANSNSQTTIGLSACLGYHNSSHHPVEDAVNSKTVKVNTNDATDIIKGLIIGIGNSLGNYNINHAVVISTATTDDVTTIMLDREVSITTTQFFSVIGIANTADAEIGSKSGYIGLDGRSIAYYRGKELYGSAQFYVLGGYWDADTNHYWIAKDVYDADDTDSLNKEKHVDTGLTSVGEYVSGYIKTLGRMKGLAFPILCTALGGNSREPVGDAVWMPSIDPKKYTIMCHGGPLGNGNDLGMFSMSYRDMPTSSSWYLSARPVLLPPR